MHVGIHKDFKWAHSQGDVGGCGGDGEDVVERLLPHVMSVDGLHQVSTAHCHHGSIHGELQLPGTELWIRVDTREPESEERDNLMSHLTHEYEHWEVLLHNVMVNSGWQTGGKVIQKGVFITTDYLSVA